MPTVEPIGRLDRLARMSDSWISPSLYQRRRRRCRHWGWFAIGVAIGLAIYLA